MAFAVAAATLIGCSSFWVAFPSPLIVSGQAPAAASLRFIELRQVMEPAQHSWISKMMNMEAVP